MNETTKPIIDLLHNMTGDATTTQVILDIADQIEFEWFEWAFKVGLVALVFLIFKSILISVYHYLRIRYDKYTGIGSMIRLTDGVIARVTWYDLQYVTLETEYGFIRVPLETWLSSTWTELKNASFELPKLRKERQELELRVLELEATLKDLTIFIKNNQPLPDKSEAVLKELHNSAPEQK